MVKILKIRTVKRHDWEGMRFVEESDWRLVEYLDGCHFGCVLVKKDFGRQAQLFIREEELGSS